MRSAELSPAPPLFQQRHGPAVLRLLMLEAGHTLRRKGLSQESREAAQLLVARFRRAIAETPSLTFADVVAKLETARPRAGEAQPAEKDLLASAIEDLRRLPGAS